MYDNVDNPKLELSHLIPHGSECVIIITSRNRSIGQLCPDARLELDVLSINEAVDLLLSTQAHSATPPGQKSCEDARAIAEALGCLPIALVQARNYMYQTKCSGEAYLQRLLDERDTLLARPVKHQLDMRYVSTYATFAASFEILTLHDQQLLWLLSFSTGASFHSNSLS